MRFTITAETPQDALVGLRCYERHTDDRTGSFVVTASSEDGEFHVEFHRTNPGVSIRVVRA